MACAYAKTHKRNPAKKSDAPKAKERAERIHSDIYGPVTPTSLGGHKYFTLYVDEATGYRIVSFMKAKSDQLRCFQELQSHITTQFGKSIKFFHCDEDSVFVSSKMQDLLKEHGTELELSAPYCHAQNFLAENSMRWVLEGARAMMLHARAPGYMWAEAVACFASVSNRLGKPYDTAWHGWTQRTDRSLEIDDFHVFGCLAVPEKHTGGKPQFGPKGTTRIFVGYAGTPGNYRTAAP